MANGLPLDISSLTDIGLKRAANEDSVMAVVPPATSPQAPMGSLFLVADGMGGPGGGAVASSLAVNGFVREYYNPGSMTDPDPADRIHRALEITSEAVRAKSKEINIRGMGTTIAGLALLPDQTALIFNVGDSRVYRLRGKTFQMVSQDLSIDSLREESARLMGIQNNVSRERTSLLTAFIGQPPPVRAVLKRDRALSKDIYLLCSDGLWSLIPDNEIRSVVARQSAEQATQTLITMARSRGAPDNVTVLVVRLGFGGGSMRRRGMVLLIFVAILLLVVLAAILAVAIWQPKLLG